MRSSNLQLQTIIPRLPVIVATSLLLLGTLFVGAAIGRGEFILSYLLLFALLGLGIVLTMGPRIWLLIPIAFCFNLPAVPFGGRAFELPELAITLCTIAFVARLAVHSRSVTIFRPSHAGVLLYAAWAGFIFVLHPVGLWAMGSASGGARFYFKIALALASFLIIANQKINERDAGKLIRILLIGSVTGMIIEIIRYKISPQFLMDPNAEEGYYTWHQALALPAMWLMLWVVSRYSMKEIFSFAKPWPFLLAMFCITIAAISGKRAGLASVLMMPAIAAALRKEYFYMLCGVFLTTILVALLTFGQGELFKLPLQVQRSLSYLPGKWDWEVRSQFQSGIDPFRQELRELAWQNIERHPLVGQGYSVNLRELSGMGRTATNVSEFGVMVMALGSSWHNTWLGIWADFGFPAVVFWAMFWLQAVAVGYRMYRRTPQGSPYHTLAMMILVYFICDILRSWTSGHSADDPFTRWWMYGVLISLGFLSVGRENAALDVRAARVETSHRKEDSSQPGLRAT